MRTWGLLARKLFSFTDMMENLLVVPLNLLIEVPNDSEIPLAVIYSKYMTHIMRTLHSTIFLTIVLMLAKRWTQPT